MKHKTILLVEDNPSDIRLTQKAFAKSHVVNELVIVQDGQEALDYLFCSGVHAGRTPSDLPAMILLDIKLPKVDGFEVLRQIRANKHTHRLPVVILTSSKEDRDIAASYDLGVNSYMQKPVGFEQFILAIQQLGLYWLVLNEVPPRVNS
jgi:two-component system, response regulator